MTVVTRLVGLLKNEKKKIKKKKIQIFFLRLFSKKSCSKMCFLKGEGFSSKGVLSARKFNNFYFLGNFLQFFVCFPHT